MKPGSSITHLAFLLNCFMFPATNLIHAKNEFSYKPYPVLLVHNPLARKGVGFLPEEIRLPDMLTALQYLQRKTRLLGIRKNEKYQNLSPDDIYNVHHAVPKEWLEYGGHQFARTSLH